MGCEPPFVLKAIFLSLSAVVVDSILMIYFRTCLTITLKIPSSVPNEKFTSNHVSLLRFVKIKHGYKHSILIGDSFVPTLFLIIRKLSNEFRPYYNLYLKMSTEPRFAHTTVPFWFSINNNHVGDCFEKFYSSITILLNLTLSDKNRFGTDNFMDFGAVIDGPDNATGLVGLLCRNVTDISLYPIPPTYKAFEYIDYSQSIYRAVWKIMSIKPMKSTHHSFAVLQTFSWKIWLCVFLSIHLIYFLSYLQAWKMKFKFRYVKEYVDILAILLLQGYNPKRRLATDIAWICWFIPLYFVTIFFSGIFLSELTLPETLYYYDSLHDLLQNPSLKIDVPRSSSVHYHFSDSNDETEKDVHEQIHNTNGLFDAMAMDLESIVSNLNKGNEVIIMETTTASFAFPTFLDCESQKYVIHLSEEDVLVESFTFMFRRGYVSSFIPKFKKFLLWYVEANLFNQDINSILDENPSCSALFRIETESFEVLPLNIDNMKFPLYVVLGGCVVSTVVLFCEVLYPPKIQRRSNRRRVKPNRYSICVTAECRFRDE